jgi:hypothetical protein
MAGSTFTRRTLRMFSGVLVWTAHFGAIYTFHALACARGHAGITWLSAGIVTWFVLAATMAAALALTIAIRAALRAGASAFENWLSASTAALSLVAVLWQGLLPVSMIPVCQ